MFLSDFRTVNFLASENAIKIAESKLFRNHEKRGSTSFQSCAAFPGFTPEDD